MRKLGLTGTGDEPLGLGIEESAVYALDLDNECSCDKDVCRPAQGGRGNSQFQTGDGEVDEVLRCEGKRCDDHRNSGLYATVMRIEL